MSGPKKCLPVLSKYALGSFPKEPVRVFILNFGEYMGNISLQIRHSKEFLADIGEGSLFPIWATSCADLSFNRRYIDFWGKGR